MEGTPAIYLGRILNEKERSTFRAYIYSSEGQKKLINSWDEFEHHMSTGLWFACNEDIDKKSLQDVRTEKRSKK